MTPVNKSCIMQIPALPHAELFETLYIKCPMPCCTAIACTRLTLFHHLLKAHNIQAFVCSDKNCKKNYSTLQALKSHYATEHQGQTVWECAHCTFKTNLPANLSSHCHYFHEKGRYYCNKKGCDYFSEVRIFAIEHIEDHMVKEEFTDEENINDEEDEDEEDEEDEDSSSLEDYIDVQSNQSQVKKCENEKSLTNKTAAKNLKMIPQISRPSVLSPTPMFRPLLATTLGLPMYFKYIKVPNHVKYKLVSINCIYDWCSEAFDSLTDLYHHLEIFHDELPFKCPFSNCRETFKIRKKLIEHTLNHSKCSSRFDGWICDHCNLALENHLELIEHKVLFTEKGCFRCLYNDCDKLSFRRIDAIDHFNRAHMADNY